MSKFQILLKIKELTEMVLMLTRKLILRKDFEDFARAIRKKESGDNYWAVNSLGYLGAYQFGMARLCDLGITKRIKKGWGNSSFAFKDGYGRDTFLSNQKLQDELFEKHVNDLKKKMKKFEKHIGKTRYGIPITMSGLVAGAHLGGIGGVLSFLSGEDIPDAYGTKVGDYISKFSGYNI